MKDKKKFELKNILKIIFIIIVLILSIICFKYIYDLGVLPNKYVLLFGSVILVLNIVASLLLFVRGIIFKIFSIFLYLVLLIVSILGIKYVGTTIKFLDKGFSNNNIEYIVYNVIVSNESNCTSLNDIKGSKMGYLFSDMSDNTYLDVIKNKANVELLELGVEKLYDELLSGNINSIIVNEGYVSLFENTYSDFSEKTRVLDIVKIEKRVENNNDVINELKPINIYLSGSDTRSGVIPTNTLSDVNMIITINPNNHKILLTSIPRDYYVKLHGTSGYKDKLTHAGFYGIDMSVNTLEDLFGIEIDYYVKVGFNSVIELVDLVGGVDIYSDTAFLSHCGDGGAKRVNVKVGMNHFNGAEALSYARERFAYSDGDVHRIKNQQQVIEAVVNKISSDSSFLLKYDTLLESLSNLYITNVPSFLVKLLIKEQLNDMGVFSIEKQNLVGYDGMEATYSIPGMKLYVMYPNQESVINASNKILEYQAN